MIIFWYKMAAQKDSAFSCLCRGDEIAHRGRPLLGLHRVELRRQVAVQRVRLKPLRVFQSIDALYSVCVGGET